MAYNTRFAFHFESKVSKRALFILVKEDGYSGEMISRSLGGSPILRRDNSGFICGTSLEWPAECVTDEEFAVFYTSDPKKFKVELYEGLTLIWTGFLTTELYADPDIAPPYDVTLTATDGLGELKNVEWDGMEDTEEAVFNIYRTVASIIVDLLSSTGQDIPLYSACKLKTGAGLEMFKNAYCNLEGLKGKSCYDVLSTILESCHATITSIGPCWLLMRETDLDFAQEYTISPVSLNGEIEDIEEYGITGLSIGGILLDAEGDLTYPNWVINQMSREVVPARKKVCVDCKPEYRDTAMPFVKKLTSDSLGWATGGNASWNSGAKRFNIPINSYVWQDLDVREGTIHCPLVLTLHLANSGSTAANVSVQVTAVGSDGTPYYLYKPESSEAPQHYVRGKRRSIDVNSTYWGTSEDSVTVSLDPNDDGNDRNATSVELALPFPRGSRGVHPVYLMVQVKNTSSSVVFLTDAMLQKADEIAGFTTCVKIDNGARGEDDTRTSIFCSNVSDVTGALGVYQTAEAQHFIHGPLHASDKTIITSFKTDRLTMATDWGSLMAKDYALSVALPRLRKTGVVNANSRKYLPVHARYSDCDFFVIETLSWDLLNDEIDLSMLSLPAASLTVESTTLTED